LLTDDPALLLAAASHYQTAASVLKRGLALEDAAVLLARGGDIRAARAAFTEALTCMKRYARDRTSSAPSGGSIVGVSRGRVHQHFAEQPTGWSALTPTEVKVAYLVANDRFNPDIAAELFVSRNTVQTHISHIVAKFAAHSRAEIVRVALAHPRAGVAGP
jgi:DNA-binding CsgD family transcriptional regulator